MSKMRKKSGKNAKPVATPPASPAKCADGIEQADGELLELLSGLIVTCRVMAQAGDALRRSHLSRTVLSSRSSISRTPLTTSQPAE